MTAGGTSSGQGQNAAEGPFAAAVAGAVGAFPTVNAASSYLDPMELDPMTLTAMQHSTRYNRAFKEICIQCSQHRQSNNTIMSDVQPDMGRLCNPQTMLYYYIAQNCVI